MPQWRISLLLTLVYNYFFVLELLSVPKVPQSIENRIPKIIHQSWKSSLLPSAFECFSKSIRAKNSDFKYILWTDYENRALVKRTFPWFLRTYDKLPYPIMRADAVRAIYMFVYGGVYLDLDFIALKPLVIENLTDIVLARLSDDSHFEHNIPNAFMMSSPNQPFWPYYLKRIQRIHKHCTLLKIVLPPEVLTGPIALRMALTGWFAKTKGTAVTLLPKKIVYVHDWHQASKTPYPCRIRSFHLEMCKMAAPEAMTLTFWTQSWGHGWTTNFSVDNLC